MFDRTVDSEIIIYEDEVTQVFNVIPDRQQSDLLSEWLDIPDLKPNYAILKCFTTLNLKNQANIKELMQDMASPISTLYKAKDEIQVVREDGENNYYDIERTHREVEQKLVKSISQQEFQSFWMEDDRTLVIVSRSSEHQGRRRRGSMFDKEISIGI